MRGPPNRTRDNFRTLGAHIMCRLRLSLGTRDLVEHMRAAEMAATPLEVSGIEFPPHENTVQVGVDLGAGPHTATVYGSDLTADYVAINADYRS